MASQSLYRKWRSQTFSELVGQEHVVQTLRNALLDDRVAHAYLFTGPRGVGKTSMARLLAKAVNCTADMPAERPCGQCQSCVSIAEGRAVDVIEMDAASHTSVDDARDLIERVQFRPNLGRYKVYIIDETHMLSTAAFNALLKTLEEPPDHAIFVLATTEVHKIPATILSRCQRFTFTRHTISTTAAHIQRVAEAEGLSLEAGVAEAIARTATGSMRDALGVLEQLASFASQTVALEQVQSLLGLTAAGEIEALVEALVANDVAAALRAVNGLAEQGGDVRQFTRDLVERLRSLMLLRATNDDTLLDVSADELEQLKGWAQRCDTASLLHWIKIFSGLDQQLRTSPYGHLPLELATVEALVTPVAAAAPAPRPQSARPKATPADQTTLPTPAAKPATTAAPPVEPVGPPPAISQAEAPTVAAAEPAGMPHLTKEVQAANADATLFERAEAVWLEVLRDVRPRDKMLQALLRDVRPTDVEDNTLVLLATSPFHRNQIERPANKQIIEEVLARHLGETVPVRCTTEERREVRDVRSQIRDVRKDSLVKAAINIFDADIVDIEADEE
jgi:DNA polymerase III subunit gamma/tau